MKRLRQAFAQRPLVTSGFLLAAALVVLFAIRSTAAMIYWSDPAHRDQTLEPWMTVRYVARSYQLPPEIVDQALGLDPDRRHRLTLGEIAASGGATMDDLAARIRAAAARHRERP